MTGATLKVSGVSKRFGPVRALNDVTVTFLPGEVHAVVGENGAGKSTLMGVLAGFVRPDTGSVELDGRAMPLGHAGEAMAGGVRLVHQHFMLVEAFTVAENLALATMGSGTGTLDLEALIEDAQATASQLGWEIDFEARVSRLQVGVRQRVEILKAICGGARVLILDEPTAVLSNDETDDLFRVLGDLRANGVCIVLIAHKLAEVMRIADRITVLRNGEVVASVSRHRADESQIARWMVGEPQSVIARPGQGGGRSLLSLDEVSFADQKGVFRLREINLQINRGEIVGIGGVEGNGQEELAEILVGLVRPSSGEVTWTDGSGRVGYVPPDRHIQGLALEMSVEENVLVERLRDKSTWCGPFLRASRHRSAVAELVKEFGIKTADVSSPVSSMSGGNQQKVVVARVVSASHDLIVANNPTRGLDFNSTAQVRSCLVAAIESGAAVVLISTDREELADLATRTLWMGGGRLFLSETEALKGGRS